MPDHPGARARDPRLVGARARPSSRLRERNRGGPRCSFIDGPVTANKTLGVHTAWGRTLKDVFQRYKALRGFDQRYQNGFDCQGLWIEVGVERSSGSTRSARSRSTGSTEFARSCREVVVWSAEELTRGSKRLGQWMDWGNDYFTFSRHEHRVHLAVPQASSTSGAGSTSATARPSGARAAGRRSRSTSSPGRRLPGPRRPVALRPLPAARPAGRVARRLDDDAVDAAGERRRRRQPGRRVRPPRERRVGRGRAATRTRTSSSGGAAPSSSGWPTRARSTPAAGRRRRAPRDPVGRGRARRGHRHRPHRARRRRGGLRALTVHDLPVLTPVDEAGRFYDDYGWLHGLGHGRGGRPDRRRPRASAGVLVEAGIYEHRYPHCWRCHTPLIFRISDDWFIAVDELRPQLLEANATVALDARVLRQAHGRLAAQHGRLEHLAAPLLRAAAAVLPVRVRPPERDRLAAPSSSERATPGLDQLEELHRPWVDEVPIRCEACGEDVRAHPRGRRRLARRRHRPVLDARLAEPGVGRGRLRDRRRRRGSRPPTCPTTPTGSSGSRPTGSPRCASRSASGSTRSSSCRSRSSAGRRSARCSATRRCSTSTAARCTAPGGT